MYDGCCVLCAVLCEVSLWRKSSPLVVVGRC